MSWVASAIGGASIGSSIFSANAAGSASKLQYKAAQAGIDETRRQFNEIRKLLSPFVEAGTSALTSQLALAGLSGEEAQAAEVQNVQNSPAFQAMLAQGENRILANASATGGLRGGNTQAAIAQFSPMLLAQQLESRYGQLGQLTGLGQNSAVGTGNAGMQSSSQIAQLLQQQGQAQAGGALGQAQAYAGIPLSILSAFTAFKGLPNGAPPTV